MDQNHEEIFSLLIESSNYYLKSLLKERDKYDEEAGPSLEFLQKSLYIAEIFLSAESKISVNKALDMFPNLPRYIKFTFSFSRLLGYDPFSLAPSSLSSLLPSIKLFFCPC